MAVIETRLSTRVEQGFTAIPMRSTQVTAMKNGQERRNARWASARRRYTGRYGSWTRAMRDELLAAIMATDGQTYAFLFKDWSDYSVTGQALTLPTGTTPVQLVKTYAFGSRTHTRTITRPRAPTVVVYEDAGSGPVAKAGTVDATTGLFTPDTSWNVGTTITADFEFDVPVRFASDEIEIVMPARDICEVNVELIEVFGE